MKISPEGRSSRTSEVLSELARAVDTVIAQARIQGTFDRARDCANSGCMYCAAYIDFYKESLG